MSERIDEVVLENTEIGPNLLVCVYTQMSGDGDVIILVFRRKTYKNECGRSAQVMIMLIIRYRVKIIWHKIETNLKQELINKNVLKVQMS